MLSYHIYSYYFSGTVLLPIETLPGGSRIGTYIIYNIYNFFPFHSPKEFLRVFHASHYTSATQFAWLGQSPAARPPGRTIVQTATHPLPQYMHASERMHGWCMVVTWWVAFNFAFHMRSLGSYARTAF